MLLTTAEFVCHPVSLLGFLRAEASVIPRAKSSRERLGFCLSCQTQDYTDYGGLECGLSQIGGVSSECFYKLKKSFLERG